MAETKVNASEPVAAKPKSDTERLRELQAKIDHAKVVGPSETWKGETVGDTIAGIHRGYHETETANGPARVLNLEVDGKPRAVVMSASIKGGINSCGALPGDLVAIIYHGEVKGRRGMTKRYTVVKS